MASAADRSNTYIQSFGACQFLILLSVLLLLFSLHYYMAWFSATEFNNKHFKQTLWLDTVGTESIQTPLNFSLFVILQPFAKII